MAVDSETLAGSATGIAARAAPQPAVQLVFSSGVPCCELLPVPPEGLLLGRRSGGREIDDPRLSREHARVEPPPAGGAGFTVRDLESRNGTFLDGARVTGSETAADGAVLRLGHSVFLLHRDGRPHSGARVASTEEMVAGPRLAAALGAVARAAEAGVNLLIRGETGTGKELAARAFHRESPGLAPGAPFVPVNCAAIPATLAESLLFGTRRGAFSGAVASTLGLMAEANGGTLFLDEVAELELPVQAKLLRAIETKEVLALGASASTRVTARVCSATLRDLRAQVGAGRFREDLYHRLTASEVVLPPLRERREEIPFLVARRLAAEPARPAAHAILIETCLGRPWPGNVRALIAAVGEAASRARAAGANVVRAEHLPAESGLAIERRRTTGERERTTAERERATPAVSRPAAPGPRRRQPEDVSRADLEACLRRHGGNVSAASRSLGLHRTQVYRLMRTLGIASRPDGGP